MNVVVLKGNLTRDPESRTISAGDKKTTTVTNFTLAVNRHFKRNDGTKDKEVTFVDCEAWDTGGETIQRYVKRGDPLLVNGSLKLDTWETDGQKRSKLKVRVNGFELLYRAPADNAKAAPEDEAVGAAASSDPASDGGDIPF
jgi:single-strand DNA-binding protein